MESCCSGDGAWTWTSFRITLRCSREHDPSRDIAAQTWLSKGLDPSERRVYTPFSSYPPQSIPLTPPRLFVDLPSSSKLSPPQSDSFCSSRTRQVPRRGLGAFFFLSIMKKRTGRNVSRRGARRGPQRSASRGVWRGGMGCDLFLAPSPSAHQTPLPPPHELVSFGEDEIKKSRWQKSQQSPEKGRGNERRRMGPGRRGLIVSIFSSIPVGEDVVDVEERRVLVNSYGYSYARILTPLPPSPIPRSSSPLELSP